MATLEQLILSGRIVEIMLTVMAIEIIVVEILRRRRGAGIGTLPLVINIGAGASLMLALRAALTEAGWLAIAAFLVASLVFHVLDVRIRWQPAAAGSGDAAR